MKEKPQIFFVGGGNAFEKKEDFYNYLKNYKLDPYDKTKRWTRELPIILEDQFDYFKIAMPSQDEADYIAWKIWFEKYLEFLNPKAETILIGYSQGGTFLLKYLSENGFSKNISGLHLIAPFVENDESPAKLMNFEFDINKINNISNLCDEMHIWYSEDDSLVPCRNSELVKKNLPEIITHVFKDRGHFFQEEFPELLEVLKHSK